MVTDYKILVTFAVCEEKNVISLQITIELRLAAQSNNKFADGDIHISLYEHFFYGHGEHN